MNWTHRFTLKNWGDWYLIDISKPLIVANEAYPYDLISVFDGWFGDIKTDETFQMEELNFSLENE